MIDTHTHIGQNNHIKANVDELITSMNKSGIDKALVFAGRINDISNEFLYSEISKYKDRLFGVAAYHVEDDIKTTDKLISDCREGKVHAVKVYLGYDHWYPNNHRICLVAEELQSLNIPLIFHTGDCLASVNKAKLKYAHPLGVDEVAVDFPNLKIVMAHLSFPWYRDAAEVCYKNKNVYSDISGFVYGEFTDLDKRKFNKVLDEFVDICSPKKLLFGTDWPISDQKSYIEAADLSPYSIDINSETSKYIFNL